MTSFKEFADTCEAIEGISSSLEMTALVSSFFQRISESDDPDTELLIGLLTGYLILRNHDVI